MKWELKKHDKNYLTLKSKEFNESELITGLLLNRGITTKKEVEKFLNTSESELYSPFLFENMHEVVERILDAKKRKGSFSSLSLVFRNFSTSFFVVIPLLSNKPVMS